MTIGIDTKIAHAANVIVCIGGLAAADGILPGAGSALSGYLSWKEVRRTLPTDMQPLATDVRDRLATIAKDAHTNDPKFLLPDMIALGQPQMRDVIDTRRNPERLAQLMLDRITAPANLPDYRTNAAITAFRMHITPIFETLLHDARFTENLAPAFQRAVLEEFESVRKTLDSIRTAVGSLAEGLRHLQQLSKDQLEALATRFEIERPFDLSEAQLRELLENKAEEYRTYRAQIDSLDDRVAGIANLKGAAQDAAERLDFDEVETLLSRVDQVETEIAAETKVARAQNALLRGNVEQAYHILSAAADSFASVDPLEPARKRILSYWSLLRDHGLRYGGAGLPLSLSLLNPVLTDDLREQNPWLWGAGMNNLAITLQNQGTRTQGPDGARLLDEAVTAYREALGVYTRADFPAEWALTQNNLGIALQDQGTRTEGPDGARLLAEAVTAYRTALEVRTRADLPVDWAMTQNNLGNALSNQGIRTEGPDGARLLAEAVTAYRAALEVTTRADHTARWAVTQNNLGNALSKQGTRTRGPDGARLLAEAVTAYRAALEVRTRVDHPVQWAMTQNNLGTALGDQGTRTEGPDGARLLAEAVTAYRTALEVRTRADLPVDWAMTQENIAIALLARADHDTTTDPRPDLAAALAAVEAALEVFDPENMSFNHAKATRLRDAIRTRLAAL